MICLKCLAPTRCGNTCCRHKSNGPYWSYAKHDDDTFVRCEVCRFEIQGDAEEEIHYYRLVANGTWPGLDDPNREERIIFGQKRYAELCQTYLTPA